MSHEKEPLSLIPSFTTPADLSAQMLARRTQLQSPEFNRAPYLRGANDESVQKVASHILQLAGVTALRNGKLGEAEKNDLALGGNLLAAHVRANTPSMAAFVPHYLDYSHAMAPDVSHPRLLAMAAHVGLAGRNYTEAWARGFAYTPWPDKTGYLAQSLEVLPQGDAFAARVIQHATAYGEDDHTMVQHPTLTHHINRLVAQNPAGEGALKFYQAMDRANFHHRQETKGPRPSWPQELVTAVGGFAAITNQPHTTPAQLPLAQAAASLWGQQIRRVIQFHSAPHPARSSGLTQQLALVEAAPFNSGCSPATQMQCKLRQQLHAALGQ